MAVHGYVSPGFAPVRAAFEGLFDEGLELGAGFAAIRDGETVVDLWGGFSDRQRTRAWSRDTLAPLYSTTKPIAALVVALLCDAGDLAYDMAIADVWPEFAANGKAEITLAMAMSHQAGLPGFVEPIDPALWLDPPALAAALAPLAPLWPPGGACGYHPITWGYIIAEVVRRVSPRTLGAILRDDICAPRGIDVRIGLPEADDARVAEVMRPSQLPDLGAMTPIKRAAFLEKWSAPDRSDAAWPRVESPSANGFGGAHAVAQVFSFFAEGGAVGGDRLVSRETYAEAIASRIAGPDLVLPFTLDWRAGVLGNSNGFYGPNRDALGHSGWGGSCGFGDPATGVSAAYVMNKQSHHLMGDPRALRLIEALYQCL
ncbi:MAG: serine hydrolase [Alphaproteobacteria bacterium]|nr:serine hydrolase [Alphaproteobacteria bacterium]